MYSSFWKQNLSINIFILIFLFAKNSFSYECTENAQENRLKHYLYNTYEKEASSLCTKNMQADWERSIDLANLTKKKIAIKAGIEMAAFKKRIYELIFKHIDVETLDDTNLIREIKLISNPGTSILNDKDLEKYISIKQEMVDIYSEAKICPFKNQKCNLEKEGFSLKPEIENIMATSRDADELLYVWTNWRDATGLKIRNLYKYYVIFSNKAAQLNNFTDMGAMWRDEFEWPNMIEDLEKLWKDISPLYDEIHKYVYYKLKLIYKQDMPDDDNYIPAHLLGNMWAQTWTNVEKLVKPYSTIEDVDLTAILKKKQVTALQMFRIANDFYESLDLPSLSDSFNTTLGAVITKPKKKRVVCHASAWDFCNKKDFRIKMCTNVNYNDFITIHHELGHILYFKLYKDQRITFRDGANPGFHEAIGDVAALSVSNPIHLSKIGLLENYTMTTNASINTLMNVALERLVFIPFALALEKWRWDVFSQKAHPDRWNDIYWKYREKYQKIRAPIARGIDDFDPGCKFHIPADSQYISYVVAHLLQFQIYRGLCIASGTYMPGSYLHPLHNCDLYKSKEAGRRLKVGLSIGSSKHWKFVLKKITGEDKISSKAILEYFEPLYNYLLQANKANYFK